MALDTLGSIAIHVNESFVLPTGVSGNMVETVDMARVDVENFTGASIGSNSIEKTYQSPIVNFSKAQSLDEAFAWASTIHSSGTTSSTINSSAAGGVKLGELAIDGENTQDINAFKAISTMSKDAPTAFRKMAIMSLESIGRVSRFSRSIGG